MRRDLGLVLTSLLVRLLAAGGLGLVRLSGPPLLPDLRAELMLAAQIVALATAATVALGLLRLSRRPAAPRIARIAVVAWLVGAGLELLRLGWSVWLAWLGAAPSWSPGGTGIAAALVELGALLLLLPWIGQIVGATSDEPDPISLPRRGLFAFRRGLTWQLALIVAGYLAVIAASAAHLPVLVKIVAVAMGLGFSVTTTVIALGAADLLVSRMMTTRALTAVGLLLVVLAALAEMGGLAVALQDPRPSFFNHAAMARTTLLGGVAHLAGLLGLLALLGALKGLAADGAPVRTGLIGGLLALLFAVEAALRLLLVTQTRVSGAWIIVLGVTALALVVALLVLYPRLLRRLTDRLVAPSPPA